VYPIMKRTVLLVLCLSLSAFFPPAARAQPPALSLATFQIDGTPPLGSPLSDGGVPPVVAIDDPLSIRGVILLPAGQQPVVLVAIDWVGVGNEGHDAWREAIADATGTTIDRVAVHALHQHDAPGCDFTAERIAVEHGLGGKLFDPEFARATIDRAATAAQVAMKNPRPVSHVGAGKAKVEKVASTRRCLGPDGKVMYVRWTTCTDPIIRDYPEGTIDPFAKAVSFWDGDQPVVVLTYYATHPQSHYGKGRVSADFPGLARTQREKALPEVPHIHFTGAGGNLGAGKYNDGSPENRTILADRLAAGMKAAWEATRRVPIADAVVRWDTRDVALPVAPHLNEESLLDTIKNKEARERDRLSSVRFLAWLRRCQAGHKITLGRLRIGDVDILHLPGELFVEYQLAAQKLRPDSFVCTAAYGDYAPGYIGLAQSYDEGGFETQPNASLVSPRVETVLMKGIAELME